MVPINAQRNAYIPVWQRYHNKSMKQITQIYNSSTELGLSSSVVCVYYGI